MLKSELLTRHTPQIPDTVLYSGNIRHLENFADPAPIDVNWINQTFNRQVRLGTGAEDRNIIYPSSRLIAGEKVDDSVVNKINTNIGEPDRKFYHNFLRNRFPFLPDRWGIREQKLSLLLNPEFHTGSLTLIDDFFIRQLNSAIDYSVERQLPLEIVIPSLPFKDQNPITTGHSPEFTDLGEELFLRRLGSLTKSFESIGGNLKIRILSDGNAYSDIFAPYSENVSGYLENCYRLVKNLGLKTKISIQDINDLTKLDDRFSEIRKVIEDKISGLLNTDEIKKFTFNFDVLRRGVLFNMQLPNQENEYARFVYLASLSDEALVTESPEVWERLNNAALKYTSFLLTMNYLKILKRAFPFTSQIRGTVHPKPGQLGIRFGETSIAPYNGVPILYENTFAKTDNIQKSVRIKRFWQIYNDPSIIACFRDGETEPYYYKKH